MMVFKKKQVIIAALVVMVGVAGYLNVSYKNDGTKAIWSNKSEMNKTEKGQENADYFASVRQEREIARSKALEMYETVTKNDKATVEEKTEAQNIIIAQAKMIETENICESMIKAKGFNDVLVFGKDGEISVLIKGDALKPEDTAKVTDIVSSQGKISVDKIKLVAIK